jgi:hypothetical protein
VALPEGVVMTDNSGASDLTSSLYVGFNGRTETFAGADDKELSTVAKRFLIAEIDRLVEENQQLRQFKEKYHDADKKLAVLRETIKPVRGNLFLSSACLMAGSAGVAAAPSFLTINQYGWSLFVGACALLLIAGIAARVEGPSTALK